jgi:hypothetical protein
MVKNPSKIVSDILGKSREDENVFLVKRKGKYQYDTEPDNIDDGYLLYSPSSKKWVRYQSSGYQKHHR